MLSVPKVFAAWGGRGRGLGTTLKISILHILKW